MAKTVADHLRTLGLNVGATGDDVRAAFRRLVLQCHPDLDRSPASTKRFVELVQAYRALQIELGFRSNMAQRRLCPRCGRYGELLDGLDGPGCPDCLLGITARCRLLPLLSFQTVKHLGTIALYAASVLCAFLYVRQRHALWAAASIGCAALGMLLLFVTCMTVPDVVSGTRRFARLFDGLLLLSAIVALVVGLVVALLGLLDLESID